MDGEAALEDEIAAVEVIDVPLLHGAERGQNAVLFAHALFGPFHCNSMIAGISFDPVPVIVGAQAENLLAHHRDAQNLPEKVQYLLGPGQTAEILARSATGMTFAPKLTRQRLQFGPLYICQITQIHAITSTRQTGRAYAFRGSIGSF
jgi:hypothetical protein